jgi:hypothetical protein
MEELKKEIDKVNYFIIKENGLTFKPKLINNNSSKYKNRSKIYDEFGGNNEIEPKLYQTPNFPIGSINQAQNYMNYSNHEVLNSDKYFELKNVVSKNANKDLNFTLRQSQEQNNNNNLIEEEMKRKNEFDGGNKNTKYLNSNSNHQLNNDQRGTIIFQNQLQIDNNIQIDSTSIKDDFGQKNNSHNNNTEYKNTY